jgi:hypothetical protein
VHHPSPVGEPLDTLYFYPWQPKQQCGSSILSGQL